MNEAETDRFKFRQQAEAQGKEKPLNPPAAQAKPEGKSNQQESQTGGASQTGGKVKPVGKLNYHCGAK